MKKKFSYKDVLYKSKRMAALGLIVVFGTGIFLASGINNDIPVHDGDVLVDSLSVQEEDKEMNGTFEEMRANLELERNKLIATLDSTIDNSKNENEKQTLRKKKSESWVTWKKRLPSKAQQNPRIFPMSL